MQNLSRRKYVQQHPVNMVKVWLKVFIPDTILGLTKKIENGPKRGHSYVPHPASALNKLGYLTDERTFNSSPEASARATIPLNIYLNGVEPRLGGGPTKSDVTKEVNLQTGEVTCTAEATEWVPKVERRLLSVNGDIIRVRISAEPTNPCSVVSQLFGKVDMSGVIELDLFEMTIGFLGKIGAVPAYEMYAQAGNGPVVALFQCSPEPGADFSSLIGDATREVRTRVDLNGTRHRIDGKLRAGSNLPLSGPGPRFVVGASCR